MLADVHHVASSTDTLLARAEGREAFVNPDGRSASVFERVWIDGVPHVVKHVHLDHDFTMRVSGDLQSRTVRAWAAGWLDAAPDLIDHAIVGASLGEGRNGWGAALLMRDVSTELFAQGSEPIGVEDHARFIDHIAGFCSATWGWHDSLSHPVLLPYGTRWAFFGHAALERERAMRWPEHVPEIAHQGWARFAERVPDDLRRLIESLRRDVTPLEQALRTTPSCLLHGDVKASNTGIATDGRTILIDWAYVGEGPPCHELAWHLALDRDRLPVSKDAVINLFQASLERHGIDTAPWWERQLGLCLLGALVQFGWEKAFGDADELSWWCSAARAGITWL